MGTKGGAMATAAGRSSAPSDERFFTTSAVIITLVMVAGFSVQLVAGRSSFDAPLLVHAHAVVFFGWVFLYLAQNLLVTAGNIALHRRLGWLATLWVVPMVGLGTLVTVRMVQEARVPFVFTPAEFLIFDPLTCYAFAALAWTAVALRRRTDWHRRLHLCAMALLSGPGLDRLLPLPLLIPNAFEAGFLAGLAFPIAGIVSDWRRGRPLHAAWLWGLGVMLGTLVLIEGLTPVLGPGLVAWVADGHPGASVPALALPPPPAR